MAKNSVRDFDATAANNTDIQSVDIAENCAPSGINNAIRELMADIKDVSAGTVALESPSADSLTVTGDLTVDTNTLYVDSTNNRVGVSNTTPSSFFSDANQLVVGSGSGSQGITISSGTSENAQIFFADGTSGNAAYRGIVRYLHSSDAMAFYTSGANERMRIDSSGNVGIGTSSPSYPFELSGTTNPILAVTDTTTPVTTILRALDSSGYVGTQTSHPLLLLTGGTERMRIDSSGNVGIGVSSPSSYYSNRLVVDGGTGEEGITIACGNTTGENYIMWADGTTGSEAYRGYVSYGHSSDYMRFGTSGSERMRIDSSGNLLVGTTSSTAKFAVTQSSNNIGAYIFANVSSGYTSTVFAAQGNQGTTNESYKLADFVNSSGSGRCFIYDSGDLDNTNGAYGSISDQKLKSDIVDATSQWDDIKALRFRKYKMIADPEQRVQMGLIAQELEETSPNLVKEVIDRDVEGNDLGTTTKSIKYSILYTKAVKALQEAITKIETLETQNASLEARIEALENA